jgi:hypothetical protein
MEHNSDSYSFDHFVEQIAPGKAEEVMKSEEVEAGRSERSE